MVVCERIMLGESVRTIGRDPAMPAAATLWRWLPRHPEFAAAYARAKAFQMDLLTEGSSRSRTAPRGTCGTSGCGSTPASEDVRPRRVEHEELGVAVHPGGGDSVHARQPPGVAAEVAWENEAESRSDGYPSMSAVQAREHGRG